MWIVGIYVSRDPIIVLEIKCDVYRDLFDKTNWKLQMSQYVSTEAGEMEQVASNLGWSEFCDWVGTLDIDTYPHLHALVTFGFDQDIEALGDELDAAVEASPPSEDVADIAEELADFLEGKGDAGIVVVSSGMTEDDGEEEDEDEEAEEPEEEAVAA